MMMHNHLYNAQNAHYIQSQAVQLHMPTPQEAPIMNFRAAALLLGEFIAACALASLPFSLGWAGFIFIGSI